MFLPGTEPLNPTRMCCTRMWSGSLSGTVDTVASEVWAVVSVVDPPLLAQPGASRTRSAHAIAARVRATSLRCATSGCTVIWNPHVAGVRPAARGTDAEG